MPCLAGKARRLLDRGRAVGAWNKLGIFYIRLKEEKEPRNQTLAVGIDPGSKFEGFSVVGTRDTVLNIMSEAPDWVKKAVEKRREMRRARRFRNTRRRVKRFDNRFSGKKRLPPSTKARWDAKLRIVQQLRKVLSLNHAVVEDVRATTKRGQRRWNENFSPIETGKRYLYDGLRGLGLEVKTMRGTETKELRDRLGLEKLRSKSKPEFESHCVDAWILASSVTGAGKLTTRDLHYLVPLQFHRRQLHRFEPRKGGVRPRYGSTLSLGLKRGTLVRDRKFGLAYVGGCMKDGLSLHSLETGERMTKNGKRSEMSVLTKLAFRPQFLPALKSGVPLG